MSTSRSRQLLSGVSRSGSPAPSGRVNGGSRPLTWLIHTATWIAVGLSLTVGGAAYAQVQPAAKPAGPPKATLPAAKKDPKAPAKDDADAPAEKEEPGQVKATRGVVVVSRAGIPLALGAVLAHDGRILTALSPLGSGNDLDVKFADGTSSKVRLGHHDRTWDLALLVPQSGKWTDGLAASSADPLADDAPAFSYSTTARPTPVAFPVELSSRRSLIGGDDKLLENAIELGTRINPLNLGAPLVDGRGRVIGVIGRGCLPVETNKPCVPVAFGIPVTTIKSFLKSVPADAIPPAPWLGIQGTKESGDLAKGVRILSVAKGSPAAKAKLKAGEDADVILAVGGEPVTNPDELSRVIRKLAVGEKVGLTVLSGRTYRQVDVVLGTAPGPNAKETGTQESDEPAAKAIDGAPTKGGGKSDVAGKKKPRKKSAEPRSDGRGERRDLFSEQL